MIKMVKNKITDISKIQYPRKKIKNPTGLMQMKYKINDYSQYIIAMYDKNKSNR